ncbi:MAG TPA: SagB family peptide dehydrogenase [Thermoanaerobaculia bacterium]|jgi:SagB-type dehydrogenase family enzyme|nr:SagB family peptide dehydrogenase [Thermoanaerobaculia bacterium]
MSARIEILLRDHEPPLAGLTPGVREVLSNLAQRGATEEELLASVIAADGGGAVPMLYFAIGALAREGALSYRVAGEGGTLVTATSKALLDFHSVDADRPLLLSRFALLRRDGPLMFLETPLSGVRVSIVDPRVMQALAMLAAPKCLNDLTAVLPPDEAGALCSLLSASGILAAGDEEDGAFAYWSFHDLLFHSRSRFGRHYGGFGGTYPFRGRMEPPPLVKPPMSHEVVALEKPELRGELTSIIEGRRSSRRFGEKPITSRELGEFLFRTARIREVYDAETGQQLSRRPYPGGGAVYELEIYAAVRECLDLRPGLYHYCPLEHRLARVGEVSAALLRHATQPPYAPPQVLLTITARIARVSWKYESMGYALILKDVGVLMQTFYLVAEAMGLGACAIGGGDSDAFAAASGVDYYHEPSVGEFMIGSKAEGAAS